MIIYDKINIKLNIVADGFGKPVKLLSEFSKYLFNKVSDINSSRDLRESNNILGADIIL